MEQNDNRKVLLENNKSIITLINGNAVEKKYTTKGARARVRQDQESLMRLARDFTVFKYDGWVLKPPSLLWVGLDKVSYGMEYINGNTLNSLNNVDLKHGEYLYGLWLGHYQHTVMENKEYGMIYTDLNLGNAIVDFKNKEFVVIDPGVDYGQEGYIYEAILQHIQSIIIHSSKRFINPLPLINNFVKGYLLKGNNKINYYYYYISYIKRIQKHIGKIKKRSIKENISFIISTILLIPLYFIYIVFLKVKYNYMIK